MTEQEERMWATRLTRIWQPGRFLLKERALGVFVYEGELGVDPNFEDHVTLEVNFGEMGTSRGWTYQLYHPPLFLTWEARNGCYLDTPDIHNCWFAWEEPEQTFLNQWMPTFRRGCWLSGCYIEASAHEKAEWMRDFTREEIEAWNLEF